MSYPINYPTPQGANVQIFNLQSGSPTGIATWVKPQGASFVWFTLIGGGGDGNGTSGGGSGAVTNFMCPAFLIPDALNVCVAQGSITDTFVKYVQKDGAGYTLLTARSGSGSAAGSATAANAFTAMGFFQSIAGQAGGTGARSASTTTFLSGGGDGTGDITGNYGYINPIPPGTGNNGTFRMQPIISGVGSNCTSSGVTRNSAIGCGGGASNTNGIGGPGLAVIITW